MRFRGVGYAPAPLNNAYELSVSIEPGVSEPSDLLRPSQPRPDDVHHHATALSLSLSLSLQVIRRAARAIVRGNQEPPSRECSWRCRGKTARLR